eukprot:TRINITY_DN30523_c0_g1_i2.p1 TRINITY_DN30523_c0_g1~~TRINITY_DN30523_c0_g1_i2.p1  ORF type:complete len:117 (-),score=12.81 TRINITY_DN30523_c0_g1_i2:25-339(-)
MCIRDRYIYGYIKSINDNFSDIQIDLYLSYEDIIEELESTLTLLSDDGVYGYLQQQLYIFMCLKGQVVYTCPLLYLEKEQAFQVKKSYRIQNFKKIVVRKQIYL